MDKKVSEIFEMIVSKRNRIIAAAALAGTFAVLYFTPFFALPHKICIPLFILGAFSIGLAPWEITAALFLSALGDLSGSFKATADGDWAFIGQMLFFALAHVFYITYFCISGFRLKRSQKKIEKHDGLYLGMVLALCVIIYYNALTRIAPCVDVRLLRICVISYASIITIMLFTALMTKDWILGLGAAFFVMSDFILAWNMFVGDVPAEKYLIMVPYFAAQAIIAGRAVFLQQQQVK